MSSEIVTLRSGVAVRKEIYDGLLYRLSLGDVWEPDGEGAFFIRFGAAVKPHSMPWMELDGAPHDVAAILEDLESSGPVQ